MANYTIEAIRWRVRVSETGKPDRYSEKEFDSEDAARVWAREDERDVRALEKHTPGYLLRDD